MYDPPVSALFLEDDGSPTEDFGLFQVKGDDGYIVDHLYPHILRLYLQIRRIASVLARFVEDTLKYGFYLRLVVGASGNLGRWREEDRSLFGKTLTKPRPVQIHEGG